MLNHPIRNHERGATPQERGITTDNDYFESELEKAKYIQEHGKENHIMTNVFKGYLKSYGESNIGGTIEHPLLIAKIYFETNKFDVDKDGRRVLRNIIRYSKRDWNLILKGFADEPGENSNNLALSTKRSSWVHYILTNIRNESTSTDKILVDNISSSAYGERGKGGGYNSNNRVVEIYLGILTFNGNDVDSKIQEILGILKHNNVIEKRMICLLNKSKDRLKDYRIDQVKSIDDLYYDYNAIWALVRVPANKSERDYSYVGAGFISERKLKLHGKSTTKEMYYNIISTNRNLSEKLEFMKNIVYRIEEGIRRLNYFLTLKGRGECNEEAAIYLKNKVIIKRSKNKTDFYSCFK